jgi:hypothetical protein
MFIGNASPPAPAARPAVATGAARRPAVRARAGIQAAQVLARDLGGRQVEGQRPSRRPTMRGKRASAMSTWCSVATSVTPRSRACLHQRVMRLARRAWGPAPTAARPPATAGRRQQRARQAHALALAARQAVDAVEQLVGQVEALQRLVRGRDVVRIEQRAQAGQQAHRRQPAGQHRGDHALARRQRRHLRRQEQPPAQALQIGTGSVQGSCPSSCRRPAAGGSAQASTCSSVVLPAPEGPITATCSPGADAAGPGPAAPGRHRAARPGGARPGLRCGSARAQRQISPALRPAASSPCSSRAWWGCSAWRG